MQDKLPVSRIKNPLNLRLILGLGLIFTMQFWLWNTETRNAFHPHSTLHLVMAVWLVVCGLILVLSIVKALRPAAEIKWGNDSLQIRGETIYPQGIQMIQIDGPDVGIKPVGKKIAPIRLTFRFIDDREQAMKELTRWAEVNGVKLAYKRFVKWM
ncbi:hypothetical protein [Paenibacillus sp. sgz5001063]|uniref:hypothetical protein n=1 Tax=Paenibacillus sp. sgz5001063 TaxID=3242474 RepID=UPI0036D4164F